LAGVVALGALDHSRHVPAINEIVTAK